MRAQPRQTQRQDNRRRFHRSRRDLTDGQHESRGTGHARRAIDDGRREGRARKNDRRDAGHQQRGNAEQDEDHHGRSLNRTPRPPPGLAAPGPISSRPAALSAAISFIRESTLPRTTSSLASMRWMVGTDRPDSSASLRWSIPRSARAARIWADEIMREASILRPRASFMISIILIMMSRAHILMFHTSSNRHALRRIHLMPELSMP